jgi:hypothetical protein
MKKLLKKVLLFLSSPLRYSIRYELRKRQAVPVVQDIGMVLQRRATESTASYVEQYMRNVDSVSTNLELLSKAMKEADLEDNQLVCEFGVYSGLTINHIASLTRLPVYGFDSFEGLPERWRDGFGKGHFQVSALPEVQPNVTLIKGWFDETLPVFIKEHDKPVGFIHIDCDLYSSTKTVLDALADRIHTGCVIVFDEYFNYPGWEDGEHKSFREFIERTGLKYEYIGYNRFHEQVAVRITGS